jgi:hypothetical protein
VFDRRIAARQLRLHALVFGVGWLVVAFGALIGLGSQPSVKSAISDLWPALQGMGFIVIAVTALPLAWPVYIALGIFEANLADRISLGDLGAVTTARRVLRVQAVAWTLAAVSLVMLAVWVGPMNGREYLVLMWLPIAAIAVVHELTARTLTVGPVGASAS